MQGDNMRRASRIIAALTMTAFSGNCLAAEPGLLAQMPVTSSTSGDRGNATAIRYTTDVSGKKVRIIGHRFYANPQKSMSFPGRPDIRSIAPH